MKQYVLYILTSFLLGACSQQPAKEKEKEAHDEQEATTVTFTAAQVQHAGIETAVIKKQSLHNLLRVNGIVDVPPQNIVSVSFPLGGYLKTTKLLPGMHVSRGEVIAVIEDQGLVQLQQDYLMAVAKLGFLQQEYDRQKELNEHKVSADKIFQQIQADFAAQKVMVKAFAEKLRLINMNPDKLNDNNISRSVPLYSPINGFVSKVNVNIGKFVNATDVLFELINPDDIHAALTVFEKDMPRVRTGQQVKVSFVDEPAITYDCEVILVTRNVDNNRSGIVHCHFHRMPKHLLPGMFLNATVETGTTEAATVPEEALVRYGNQQYVLLVTGPNTYTLTAVETGIRDNGRTQVSSSATDLTGKQVIIKNAYAVLGKMKNTKEEDH
jgi:membrane fusion protein, heavy metal efflux system